jgi:hypothetical protein
VRDGHALRLPLSASYGFGALIVAAHALAAGCFLTILQGWTGFALAFLALALGAAAAWDRALLRGARSPRMIELHPSGEAWCGLANGESLSILPPSGNSVSRIWVALRLDSPRRRSLLVTQGMVAPDAFRRLRLWARWGKLAGVAARPLPA